MTNSVKGISESISELSWALKDKKKCPGHTYRLKVDENQCVVNIKSSLMAEMFIGER